MDKRNVFDETEHPALSPGMAIHCIWYMAVYLVCFVFYFLLYRFKNVHSAGQSQLFHTSVLEVGLSYRPPQEPESARSEPNLSQSSKDLEP